MRFLHWAKGIVRLAGIDQAVAFTLAGHLWNVATAPLLLVLMIRSLEVGERGVLFNFISICQVQVIFALGVGTVIQQLASRQRAFLQPQPDGTFSGDRPAKQRLASLFRGGLLWFLGIAVTAFFVLLPVGWGFFQTSPGTESVSWKLPWILTLFVAVLDSAVNSVCLFLSGCGQVTEVARVTALKQAVMTSALMLGLLAGIRLLAHPASGFLGIVVCLGWLLLTRRRLLVDLWQTPKPQDGFRWRRDVWPLQWRVSTSWLSTMIVMHGLNPATLYWQGAESAGQVGLSMYILLTIQNMGWSWMATRIPQFGVLAAQRRWKELMHTFRAVLTRSTAFILAIGGTLIAVSTWLHHEAADPSTLGRWLGSAQAPAKTIADGPSRSGPSEAIPTQPLLAPWPLVLLVLAVVALHIFLAQAALLRAHGHDPILPTAVLLAGVTILTLAVAGQLGSVLSMIAAYAVVVGLLALGLGTWVTRKALREWHVSG